MALAGLFCVIPTARPLMCASTGHDQCGPRVATSSRSANFMVHFERNRRRSVYLHHRL